MVNDLSEMVNARHPVGCVAYMVVPLTCTEWSPSEIVTNDKGVYERRVYFEDLAEALDAAKDLARDVSQVEVVSIYDDEIVVKYSNGIRENSMNKIDQAITAIAEGKSTPAREAKRLRIREGQTNYDRLTTRTYSKPNIEEPVMHSNEVQDLIYAVGQEVLASLTELLGSSEGLYDLLRSDERVKQEYYGLFEHFADRYFGNGNSRKGVSVDRAEAKLRVWNNLFVYGNLPWV